MILAKLRNDSFMIGFHVFLRSNPISCKVVLEVEKLDSSRYQCLATPVLVLSSRCGIQLVDAPLLLAELSSKSAPVLRRIDSPSR